MGGIVDSLIERLDATAPLVAKARHDQVGGHVPAP